MSQAPQWPAVSVILPVKGCRAHSFEVWRSQLGLQYGMHAPCLPELWPLRHLCCGSLTSCCAFDDAETVCPCAEGVLEFLFVLDSAADPAYGAISALLKESKGRGARIVVASAASTNSQKINKCVADLLGQCRA